MIFDLVRDFSNALDAMPTEHRRRRMINLVGEAIRRDIHFIDRHPTTIFQCMWNTCWWHGEEEVARVRRQPDLLPNEETRQTTQLAQVLEQWHESRSHAIPGAIWIATKSPPAGELGTGLKLALHGHTDKIRDCHLLPQENIAVTCALDGTARIWDCTTQKERHCLQHQASVYAVDVDINRRVCITHSTDGTRSSWDVISGALTRCDSFSINRKRIVSAALSPDCRRLAIVDKRRHVQLWDVSESACDDATDTTRWWANVLRRLDKWYVRAGSRIAVSARQSSQLTGVEFSVNGTQIVTSSSDGRVCLWDTELSAEHRTLHGTTINEGSPARDMRFMDGGARLLTVHEDGKVNVWNTSTGDLLSTIAPFEGATGTVANSPDGRNLATLNRDGPGPAETVKIWSVDSSMCSHTLSGHDGGIQHFAFSPDSKWLACAGMDRIVRIWNVTEGKLHNTYQLPEQWVSLIDFADGSDSLVVASYEGQMSVLRVWDFQTVAAAPLAKGHSGFGGDVHCVSVLASGRWAATGDHNGKVCIWDCETGSLERSIVIDQGAVLCHAFSPNADLLLVGVTNSMQCWSLKSGELAWVRGFPPGKVTAVTYSTDAQKIAISHGDSIVLLDSQNRYELTRFAGSRDVCVDCVVFSIDAKLVASGGRDGVVRVWDTSSGKKLFQQRVHTMDVVHLEFASAGHRLLTAGKDGWITEWDIDNSMCVRREEVAAQSWCESTGVLDFVTQQRCVAQANSMEVEFRDVVAGKTLGWFSGSPGFLRRVDEKNWLSVTQNHVTILELRND